VTDQSPDAWCIASADALELAALRRLLIAEALPHQGVEARATARFLVASTPGCAVAGGVGLEEAGRDALLRSLVVDPSHRGAGVGARLVEAIEVLARQRDVRMLYLLTTTAAGFFAALGYRSAERALVPAALQRLEEFSTLCPASADCLCKPLGRRIAAGGAARLRS
jgi:amino-acid N-acetyltransferase